MTTSDMLTPPRDDAELAARHAAAEAILTSFSYRKPDQGVTARDSVILCKTDLFRARIVVIKKDGGESNLHYHTAADSFWMVLKGRMRFYGPDNKLIGEFGPNEGTSTPRYSRYWFENAGDEDLEVLHLFIYAEPGSGKTGHTNIDPPKAHMVMPGGGARFDASKK